MKVSIFTLFFSCSVNILASDKSSKMTNNSIGQSPAFNKVEDPVQYYVNRLKAHELVRQEDWQAAQPILESLTNQFADDGDTWYILGLTYLQLQEWEKAIVALKKTLKIGTILSDIPTGSAPSNDIMINIAEAYAELEQAENAITWINKSLAFRYDDRKNLIDNIHFKKIANSKAFQEVSGVFLPNNLSRVESWQFDLLFLVS
jgi:tetratricopeptide (TPR) repeat protein